jgi:F-type H+-transporting ATPase subunit gamma
MLGTKEIKRRIRGVTNIQQITRAMEMVAASRLKKAQIRAEESRPYFSRIKTLMEDLLAWSDGNPESRRALHTLPTHGQGIPNPVSRKIGLILITSDRGLCGGYIANVVRQAQRFIRSQKDQKTLLIPIGKRGYDFFRRRGYNIHSFFSQPSKEVTQDVAHEIANKVLERYEQDYHELHILYSKFESATKSTPIILKLLPLTSSGELESKKKVEPILEPEAEIMVEDLLPQYISAQIYGAMSESLASEQGARMVAMRSATDNAEDMIKSLTLTYNKARQASITTELLEVVTGAEALRNQ